MALLITEKLAKTALVRSRIEGIDYALNPYTGCAHGCRYCYAEFMQRFSQHHEPWGTFVDVKINVPQLLENELQRIGSRMTEMRLNLDVVRASESAGSSEQRLVSLSTVTDPYQPLERKYLLTRRCLEVLLRYPISVSILTKSPLVLRDIDLLKKFKNIDVGLTITTDRDEIRQIFEPAAPPIPARIAALRQLHEQGIRTWVFIGPVLPMDPVHLGNLVKDCIHYHYIDPMNYIHKSRSIYQRHRLGEALRPAYFENCRAILEQLLNCDY
ncbi:MAG: radical SAM protein [candidate division KSB1 bacterium]|nr:radical SAM protein [candidate division KSB1 bacterium]